VIVPEYTPGEWYAVVAGGVVLLLAPSTPPEVVRDVWATAPERGGGLGAQLDALVRHGLGGLHPFAAVDLAGGKVHTALRGDVEVEVVRGTRAEVLSAPEVVSWSERSVGSAEEVTVRVSGAGRGAALPIVSGVVRASRVRVRLTGAEPAREAEAAPSEPVVLPAAPTPVAVAPARAAAVEDVAVAPAEVEAAPAAVAEPVPAGSADVPSGTEVVEGTPAPAEVVEGELVEAEVVEEEAPAEDAPAEDAPAEESPAEDAPAEVEEHDAVAEAPAAPAPAPAPTPAPPAAAAPVLPSPAQPYVPPAPPAAPALPGPASADDHDGLTILSGELASIRQHLPSWAVSQTGDWPSGPVVPTPAPAPGVSGALPVTAAPTAQLPVPRLALSTGALVPVDAVVLIGRAPQADRAPDGSEARLVTVPSPEQDISRTHAEVRLEAGRVLVTDLYSTNGITVATGTLPPRRVTAGEPVAVAEGDVVDLGDGVTFTVEPGA
jgi:resuscitation-promoting factor RpfA